MMTTRKGAVKARTDPPHLNSGRVYRLTFGRYKGSTLAECDEEYLLWLADNAPAPALRLLAKRELQIDIIVDENEPPRTELASTAFPRVCWIWNETMRDHYARDESALEVVRMGHEALKALCSEVTNKPFPVEGGAE